MKRYALVMVLLTAPVTTWAVSDGSGWQILVEIKHSITLLTDQIKIMKQGLELYRDMSLMAEDKERSRDVFANPLFKKYVGDVSELEGFNDTVQTLEDMQEIDSMIDDIDLEIARATGKDKAYWEQQRDLYVTYRNLASLRNANQRSFVESGRDNAERKSSNITANSTAGLYKIELDRAAREKQQQHNKLEAKRAHDKLNSHISGGYTALGAGDGQ